MNNFWGDLPTWITAITAIFISCIASIIALRQLKAQENSNKLLVRNDYYKNYKMLTDAFGIIFLKGTITKESLDLITSAHWDAKILLTQDVADFTKSLYDFAYKVFPLKEIQDIEFINLIRSENFRLELVEIYQKYTRIDHILEI